MAHAYDQIVLPLEKFRKVHIGGVKASFHPWIVFKNYSRYLYLLLKCILGRKKEVWKTNYKILPKSRAIFKSFYKKTRQCSSRSRCNIGYGWKAFLSSKFRIRLFVTRSSRKKKVRICRNGELKEYFNEWIFSKLELDNVLSKFSIRSYWDLCLDG